MATINIINFSQLENKKRIESEFYQKKYMDIDDLIKKTNHIKLRFASRKITDGTHYTPKYVNEGVKFYSALNVKENFFNINDKYKFITEKEHKLLYRRCNPEVNDILLRKVGVGSRMACVVPENLPEFSIFVSVALIKLKANLINSYYLSTFINCKYGQSQLLRIQKGASQPDLHLEDIAVLKIPTLSDLYQNEVEVLVKKGIELQEQSLNLYKLAESLVEEELALNKINLDKPKTFLASFSEAIDFMRIDSEYFQPKFRKINELVKSYKNGYERLLSNITYVKPDFNVSSHKVANIKYIELSKINPVMGFIDDVDEIDKKDAPSRAKRMVMTGDVIASSVVGSVDKAGLVSENENGFIASNGFFQFRSNYYSPEYLLILIKSTIIKEQFQQQSTGGILSAVPEQNLKHIVIPKIDIEIQKKITVLVKDAHQKARISKELLAQAKNRVEQLIEEAANKN